LRRELFFDHALLPSGWADDVRLRIENGSIVAVSQQAAHAGAEHIAGIALPGVPNLHCHAFQRGMAALAERRGPASDSFWTWREVMYRFLERLTPDDVEAIAAFAYMEMLEAGFTTVGEFHYLHHDIDGRPYADLGETAARIAAASAASGIALTLLPSFYAYGGFGGVPAAPGQRRFLNDPERFARLVERSRAIVAGLPGAQLGIAPHSLRAVTPQTLQIVCAAAPQGPIHIHVAEQAKEVEESVAVLGHRPVEWLIENAGVDRKSVV
jgi:formimidoylglutamate deiminase